MASWHRWGMSLALAALLIYAPFLYYRCTLEHSKRLRPIDPGRVYRSGCLTADGFRDAIQRYGIKTVISLWDENPDPDLRGSRLNPEMIRESELCASLGAHYQYIFIEFSNPPVPPDQSNAVKEFLAIMDNPASYPVLIHCKAGLHRTGTLSAIYRMEYDGWSREDAMRELKSHGFGYFLANTSNPYIVQYVTWYQPRAKASPARAVPGVLTSGQK